MLFSLLSLNVRGLRNRTKRKAVFIFCKEQPRVSCFFLQETHSIDNDDSLWKYQWASLDDNNYILVNLYGFNNLTKNKRLVSNLGTRQACKNSLNSQLVSIHNTGFMICFSHDLLKKN